MKVLQVIPFFSPKFGGEVATLYHLSKELAIRGHDVTIITTDFEFDRGYAKEIEEHGVTILPFRTLVHFGLFIFTPSLKTWLKNNIAYFDVIHMHSYRSYQNIIACKYGIQNHIPYIVHPEGSLPLYEKPELKRFFDLCWGNQILKNASNNFALTKHEADQLQLMGVEKSKITIMPSCVDLCEFENLPKKGTFKLKYGIKQDEKVILFLGRINKIKGIDILIDAFFELSKEMDNIKLVVVGPDNGFLDFLLKKTEYINNREKIIFTGMVNESDKLAAYVDAEVYVLPSRYEAFGTTVLEAWACGTLVIMSEWCLISEFLPNRSIIFKSNINELKDLIKQILQDDQLRLISGDEGKQLMRDKFNWSKTIEDYIFCYSDAIRKNNEPQ